MSKTEKEEIQPIIHEKKTIGNRVYRNNKLVKTWIPFMNLKTLDLSKAYIPEDVTALVLQKIKSLEGLSALSKFKNLRELAIIDCYLEKEEKAKKSLDLNELRLFNTNEFLLRSAFKLTRTLNYLVLTDYLSPKINCSLIVNEWDDLNELNLQGRIITNSGSLEKFNLKNLWLERIIPGKGLAALLKKSRNLSALGIKNILPVEPDYINIRNFKKLERISIIVHPGTEKSWNACKKENPDITFNFLSPADLALPLKGEKYELEKVYKGIAIMAFQKNKEKHFHITEDIINSLGISSIGNNGDLENFIIKELGSKEIERNSEADTFEVRSKNLKKIEEIIDLIHTLK